MTGISAKLSDARHGIRFQNLYATNTPTNRPGLGILAPTGTSFFLKRS
jgi:hypothetical protein